jgi:hypothetical protein
MSRYIRLMTFVCLASSKLALAAPQEVPVLEERSGKARSKQTDEGYQMSYAPFVIVGVLAVGGIIAALAASNSSSNP